MTERLEFIEVEHEWGTTHHFEYKGNRIQENEVAELFNELYKENDKLKQLLQKIITKEFELSSDDNGYDPLTEFFNNEVNISQIEVDINVEKEEKNI